MQERARAQLERECERSSHGERKVPTFLGEAEKRVLFDDVQSSELQYRRCLASGLFSFRAFYTGGVFTGLALAARSAREREAAEPPPPPSPPEERSDDRGEAARGEAAHACRALYMQGFL